MKGVLARFLNCVRGVDTSQIRGVYKNRLNFRFIGWYFLANTVVFWCLGWGYLTSILKSASLFKNTMADFSSLVGKIVVILFTLVNYFSYMMLLAFIPAFLVVVVASFIQSRRLITWMSVFLAACSVIFLITDSRIYAMFKFHFNATILSFIGSPQWREVFDFSQYELLVMVSAVAAIFFMEVAIAWVVWKKIILVERFKIGKTIAVFWLGGALFSYFTLMLTIVGNNNLFSLQTPSLPLFNQLFVYVIPDRDAKEIVRRYSEQNFYQSVFPRAYLHYPLHPLRCHVPDKAYNIILIMVDSLRFDSLQSRYMPNTVQFAKRAWQFLQHFSGGNGTQSGLFALFYSIPSNYWTSALEQKKTPLLINLLVQYGYEAQIFWSSEMNNPPFDKTIYAGLPNLQLEGAPGEDVGNWDRYTTNQAIQFLTSRKQKRPFFLNLFYDAPHAFCSDQSFTTLYRPVPRYCSRIALHNGLDPKPYYNSYLNAVTFIDDEVGKVIQTIEKYGYLKNSIVMITSDHGQEFNDNQQNYWGHSSNFSKAQMHVPLILFWPGEEPKNINYVTSGYDIVPTLLTRLFSCENPISDYSIGQSLLVAKDRPSFLLVGGYVNMGIIEPDRLTTLERSGRVNITDTKVVPLPNAEPRVSSIHQALSLMRKYFSK